MQINFLGTRVNTLFYNDLHGSTANIDSFLKAQQEYYKNNPTTPNLTLSGGDVFVTTNPNNDWSLKDLWSNSNSEITITFANNFITTEAFCQLFKKIF